MPRFLAAFVVLASAACALADIAPDPLTTGGTSLAEKGAAGTEVAMISEEVDIHPSADRNTVTATFVLRNNVKQVVDMEVGFPNYFEMPLKDFVAEVDGKPVAAEVKKTDPAGPKKFFTVWMCWPMHFEAGQQRTVKVSYWVATRPDRYLRRHEVIKGRPTVVFEPAMSGVGLPKSLRSRVGARSSGYVLRTGAGWQGAIGQAVIRLHYGEGFRRDLVSSRTPADGWTFDADANTDTLVLNNLEPTGKDDINYQWRLSDVKTQKALLSEALHAGELGLPARMEMAQVLGYNANSVRQGPPNSEQLDVLLYSVAPLGVACEPNQALRYEQQKFLHKAYAESLKHYQSAGKAEQAKALAAEYAKFLQQLIAARQAEAERTTHQGSKDTLARQIAGLKAELQQVQAVLGPEA